MANLRADNLTGTGGRNAITGSVYFGGDNDKAGLTIADNTDLELGSETNWTIEFWIKLNHSALSDWDVVMGKGSASGNNYEWFVEVMSGDHLVFLTTTAGSAWDFNQQITPALVVGEWYHIAIVRNGSGANTLKSYVNGQQYSTHTSQNIHTSSYKFGIGHFAEGPNSLHSDITLSDVRVVKGTSVYTAAFAPPTEKLTAVDGTVLLCCQDSDDPTQEATGKTITGYASLQKVTGDDTDLVTNGDFNGDISGWTNAQGTWAYNAGKAHMTGTSGNSLEQNVTTVVGKRYRVTATVDNTANVAYNVGITFGGTQNYVASNTIQTASKTFIIDLIATSTSTLVDLWGGTAVTGYWSYVSVKLLEPPKQPKDLPPVGVDEGVVFNGDTKINSKNYMYFPTGDTSQRGRGRGLFAGGGPSYSKQINYIQIQSQGNTTKFGDLITALADMQGGSSSTRGLFGGGLGSGSPGFVNTIEYVTIATTSNATNFGDLNETNFQGAALANDTRYVYGGGTTPTVKDVMDYVTIASAGNATDFGNLTVARFGLTAFSSPTRGIFAGGATPTIVNTIDYITIASAGNATDFGDVTSEDTRNAMGVSNNTRGVIAGGQTPAPSNGTNAIDFLTIATTGNTTDFGDLTDGRRRGTGLSNSIRGVFFGGYDPNVKNIIDFVTIATTGDAADFGDYSGSSHHSSSGSGCSDSHGGLAE